MQPDPLPERSTTTTSAPLRTRKARQPQLEIPRTPIQIRRSVEPIRKPGIQVIEALKDLDERFQNPRCLQCDGNAQLDITNEGIVISCSICKKAQRVDSKTLQRLADHLAATCFWCKKQRTLKSVERSYGNILSCQNPICGRNNTWQGISERIGRLL